MLVSRLVESTAETNASRYDIVIGSQSIPRQAGCDIKIGSGKRSKEKQRRDRPDRGGDGTSQQATESLSLVPPFRLRHPFLCATL